MIQIKAATQLRATSSAILTITSDAFADGMGRNSYLPWKFIPPAKMFGQEAHEREASTVSTTANRFDVRFHTYRLHGMKAY